MQIRVTKVTKVLFLAHMEYQAMWRRWVKGMSEHMIWIGKYDDCLTKIVYWSNSGAVFVPKVMQWKGGSGWFFTEIATSNILPNLVQRGG